MMLPTPPPPPADLKPSAGRTAEHFADYSTKDLVNLLRQTGLPDDLDLRQDGLRAHSEGRASYGDILISLHQRASREVFDEAVALCGDPDPHQRITGLWLLREIGPSEQRPLYPETWAVLDHMAATEERIEVLRWVVMCLGFTYNPMALEPLISFSSHPDEEIRQFVAFQVASCSEPNDPRMIEVQLRLCTDEEAEVRGHAAYDFANGITADTPEIRRTLESLLNDSDEAVASSAIEALAQRQ